MPLILRGFLFGGLPCAIVVGVLEPLLSWIVIIWHQLFSPTDLYTLHEMIQPIRFATYESLSFIVCGDDPHHMHDPCVKETNQISYYLGLLESFVYGTILYFVFFYVRKIMKYRSSS